MMTLTPRSLVLLPTDAIDINGEPHMAAGLRYMVDDVFPPDHTGFTARGILVSTTEEIEAAARANTQRRAAAGVTFDPAVTAADIIEHAAEVGLNGLDCATVIVLRAAPESE